MSATVFRLSFTLNYLLLLFVSGTSANLAIRDSPSDVDIAHKYHRISERAIPPTLQDRSAPSLDKRGTCDVICSSTSCCPSGFYCVTIGGERACCRVGRVCNSIGNGCADSTWVDCGSYCCDAGETCGSGTCLSGGSPVPGPTSTRSRSSSRTSSTRTRTSSVPTLDPDTDTFDEDGAIEGITTNKRVALLILVLVVGALVMV